MNSAKSEILITRVQKFKKILNILVPVLFVTSIVLFLMRRLISSIPSLSIWLFFIIGTIIIVILSRKFYNWVFAFLVLIITAFYLRSVRMPPWGLLLALGFSGIICISFYSAFYFLKRFDHNKFLKYIGFSSGIILTSIFMGQMFKMMHWPMAGILQTVGVVLFTPFLFAFILLLPGADYVNWSKNDRVIFFRVIIIPMIFIYGLINIMYTIPIWAMFRPPLVPFGMFSLDLFTKPGILF